MAVAALLSACGGNDVPVLASRYAAIAGAANHRLDVAHDALDGADRDSLAAAAADLRSLARAESQFDHDLLALPLPDHIAATARALVDANQARIELTMRVAASRTLDELHAGVRQLDAADAAVEAQVRTIRRQLGLPPPDTG